MSFGENLKKYREQNGLTQKDLAKTIGKSIRSISYYETSGKDSIPDSGTLEKIAKELKVSVSVLLGIEEDSSPEERIIDLLEEKTLHGEITWYLLNEELDALIEGAAEDIGRGIYFYKANPIIIKDFLETYKFDFQKYDLFYSSYKKVDYFIANKPTTSQVVLVIYSDSGYTTIPFNTDKEKTGSYNLFLTIKDVKTRDYSKTIYSVLKDLEEGE